VLHFISDRKKRWYIIKKGKARGNKWMTSVDGRKEGRNFAWVNTKSFIAVQ
jgi:hypothetical protein